MQPFDSDTDPVRRAFLSNLDKLLWEFGRGEDGSVPEDLAQGPVPGGDNSTLPETVPTSVELKIQTPDDARSASPGRKPVLQQRAREGTDSDESCDSSEESLVALEAPAARALKEERAENLSASSTPLSVLSPTSPRGSRGFSRGLEEREGSRGSRRGLEECEASRGVDCEVSRGVDRGLGGLDGADEGRVELSQVDSCASVAGAATAGHVSGSPHRRIGGRDGAQVEVGLPARSDSEKRALFGSRKTGGGDIGRGKGKKGVGNDTEILERIRQLLVSGGTQSSSPKRRKGKERAESPNDDSDMALLEKVGSRKSVAIQAESSSSPTGNQVDQKPQVSSKARARPPAEDGEFERSSGEMYSSGDDSAGARVSLIPEYVRKDVSAVKRRVRKAHHGASARGARAVMSQTEEEGFVRKTAVERLVESVKEEKGESEEEDVEREREEFQEDAVYVQVSEPGSHEVGLIYLWVYLGFILCHDGTLAVLSLLRRLL